MLKSTFAICLTVTSLFSLSTTALAQSRNSEGGSHTGVTLAVGSPSQGSIDCSLMSALVETVQLQIQLNASQRCVNDSANVSFDCKKFKARSQAAIQATLQAQQYLEQQCDARVQQAIQD